MSIYKVGGDQNGTSLLCCPSILKNCPNQPKLVSNESLYLYELIWVLKFTLCFTNFSLDPAKVAPFQLKKISSFLSKSGEYSQFLIYIHKKYTKWKLKPSYSLIFYKKNFERTFLKKKLEIQKFYDFHFIETPKMRFTWRFQIPSFILNKMRRVWKSDVPFWSPPPFWGLIGIIKNSRKRLPEYP